MRPSTAAGGPGQITDPLRLGASAREEAQGEGQGQPVRATITFTPKGGECVALFKQCYSAQYAASQTATLKVKGQRKK